MRSHQILRPVLSLNSLRPVGMAVLPSRVRRRRPHPQIRWSAPSLQDPARTQGPTIRPVGMAVLPSRARRLRPHLQMSPPSMPASLDCPAGRPDLWSAPSLPDPVRTQGPPIRIARATAHPDRRPTPMCHPTQSLFPFHRLFSCSERPPWCFGSCRAGETAVAFPMRGATHSLRMPASAAWRGGASSATLPKERERSA
jgi:hypothetical protein